MELSKPLRNSVAAISAVSLGFLAAGCGEDNGPFIEGGMNSRVINKSTESTYGYQGYYGWSTDWFLTLEQCGREDTEVVGEDGCITLEVDVAKSTYEDFAEGDLIVFEKDKSGNRP